VALENDKSEGTQKTSWRAQKKRSGTAPVTRKHSRRRLYDVAGGIGVHGREEETEGGNKRG